MPSRKQHLLERTTTVSTQASPVPTCHHRQSCTAERSEQVFSTPYQRVRSLRKWSSITRMTPPNIHLFCIQLQAASHHHFFHTLKNSMGADAVSKASSFCEPSEISGGSITCCEAMAISQFEACFLVSFRKDGLAASSC
jgi:hypothetical protein